MQTLLWYDSHITEENYLLPAACCLQPAAVSLSGGETCHCSAAGPEQQRSAAGYTPHTASTCRSDLKRKAGTRGENYIICLELQRYTVLPITLTSQSPEDVACGTERLMDVGVGMSISSWHIPPKPKMCPLSRNWEGLRGVFIPAEEKREKHKLQSLFSVFM